jgi:hypothetical protein
MDDVAGAPLDPSTRGPGRSPGRVAGVVALFVAAALVGVGLGVARPWVAAEPCGPGLEHPGWSVARQWNEALLDAVRRDLPAPTVHARNLFHVSAAMWDAWAAYDPDATGVFVDEKVRADDVEAARREAMSYAAYRILEVRYLASAGASDSIPRFDRLMEALCYPAEVTTTEGDDPAALGNRIAAAVLAAGLEDGSNEAGGYADPTYSPVNPPLVVAEAGTTLADPDRWQPLQLAQMISQNGIPIADGVQEFIGPHWGRVAGFALPPAGDDGVPVDPGPTPDFARVLAEFWADGPDSETPPGHWNTIANTVSDALDPELRIGGAGEPVDRLEWDVKLYLALNGATHDAAVAAWGLKGHYDSIRPISMIRYMGGLGQSSDPAGPSYDPRGLPLVDGLAEVVTEASSRPGGRHAGFADHLGEVVVRAWAGNPDDPETATGSEYVPGGLAEWTIPAGWLEFEAGPTTDVTLQWATYADAADQAGLSRLYGGIHIAADDFAGRRIGAEVGRACWERAQRLYAGVAVPKG